VSDRDIPFLISGLCRLTSGLRGGYLLSWLTVYGHASLQRKHSL